MEHKDLLTGFNMVAAITQDTVNYQFSQLFKQQVIHNSLDIVMADTGIELKATLSAPTASFSIPDAHRSVLFMLNMPSGQFSYYEGFGPSAKKHTIDFTDWVYAFQVNMDMLGIQQEAIKAGAAIPQVVKDSLTQFSDSMFTIQHIFMDFQNADLANYDPSRTKMKFPDGSDLTPGQMTQFQNAIQNYFTSLKGTDNPFILGYTIEAKNPHSDPSAVPTFVPTGATFSTFSDPKTDGLNTLNFLIMADNNPFPTSPAAGIFDKNWVTSNDNDGKFIISSDVFFNRWLLPIVTNSLNLGNPSNTSSGWSFTKNTSNSWKRKDQVKCYATIIPCHVDGNNTTTEENSANVGVSNPSGSQAKIGLSGRFYSKYELKFQCLFNEEMWSSAEINWTGNITLTVGSNAEIDLKLDMNVPSANKDTGGNWIGKWDIALIPDNQKSLNNIASSFETSMKNALNRFKSGFTGGLNNRFILPAGDVFFFKNVQFDTEGNVTLDITYKSLHEVAQQKAAAPEQISANQNAEAMV